ncbi:hypothetical protein VTJ04DRAFT_972 [Mycothermus thermophilus]
MPTAPEGERNEPGKDEERVSILKLQPEKRKKGSPYPASERQSIVAM